MRQSFPVVKERCQVETLPPGSGVGTLTGRIRPDSPPGAAKAVAMLTEGKRLKS
jgi:hypothetical protein